MAGYNLGGYSSDLTLDDYNSALQNSGADFQLEQPQLGASAQPAMQQASSSPQPQALPEGVQSGSTLDPTRTWEPPPEKKNNSMLGKVLGIVGGIVGGGAGAVLGGVGQASEK